MLKIEIIYKPYKGSKIKIKNRKDLKAKLLETAVESTEGEFDAEIRIKDTK